MKTAAPTHLLSHLPRRTKSYEQLCSTVADEANVLLLQRAASMRLGTSSSALCTHSQVVTEAEVEVFPSSTFVQKKRVSFGENWQVMVVPRAENKAELWWDQLDFAARRYLDSVVVDQCKLSDDTKAYHEAVLYLMKSFQQEYQSRAELTDCVKTIRATNVRGLESRIVPLLKAQRAVSVREILKLQKKLQAGSIRPEMASNMLRRKSLKMSRAARQLAFRNAQADRMDAKEIYAES